MKCGHRLLPVDARPGRRRLVGLVAIAGIALICGVFIAFLALGLITDNTEMIEPLPSGQTISPTLVRKRDALPTATMQRLVVPTASPTPTSTRTSTPMASPTATPTHTPTATPIPPPPSPTCFQPDFKGMIEIDHPLMRIRGRVLNRWGGGMGGVLIRIQAYGWSTEMRTWDNGYYYFDGLANAVEYMLSLPEYPCSGSERVEMEFGSEARVDFQQEQ